MSRIVPTTMLAAVLVVAGGCRHDATSIQVAPEPIGVPTDSSETAAASRVRPADSRPMRFLGALERAETIEIVSLASREAEMNQRAHADKGKPGRGSAEWYARNEAELDAAWCATPDGCLEGNRVLGRVRVEDAEGRRAVLDHMRQWLAFEPTVDFACIPEFRHAVEFETAGVRRRILLCYDCAHFQLREGDELRERADSLADGGSAGSRAGHAWFAQRFSAAGIPVEVPRH
jgi:hypothetical protein